MAKTKKNKVVAESELHIGEKGKVFWDAFGMTADWCCMFVWYCFKQAGLKSKFYNGGKTASVDTAYSWAKGNLTKVKYGNEKAGDLIFFDWNSNNSPDHIGLIQKKGYSIEGNSGNNDYTKSKVINRKISDVSSYIFAIYRPKYTDSDSAEYETTKSAATAQKEVTRKSFTFTQGASPWGRKPYPGGADDMSSSGCGPTSIANILANSISPTITPLDTWKYMNTQGYGIPDRGSTWAGMTATLRHFGVECTQLSYPSGEQIFNHMNKGKRFAIFSFGGGTQGGVTWTLGGHFVAATGYKVENGNHYFYTRDSNGSRNNNGWHSFEKTMSSLVVGAWICTSKSNPDAFTTNAEKGGTVSSGGYADQTPVVDSGGNIVLKNQIAKLQSSDNYTFISQTKKENDVKTATTAFVNAFKVALQRINPPITECSSNQILAAGAIGAGQTVAALLDSLITNPTVVSATIPKQRVTGTLLSYPSMVEAPVIVLNLNGVVIGGFGNSGDMYPNYITSLTVNKFSGRINQYTINLVHQVRFGEDPNFIDKLLSRTGFTNKIQILYGDATSGELYRDDEAVVTDVSFNEDVASKAIHYTITALSSIMSVTSISSNYSAKTEKPSTLITDLLYSNATAAGEVLLDALPGMRDRALVLSSGLIPTTDDVVTTQALVNTSPIGALNYYVSGMTNENNSIFTLTYNDDTKNEFGGAYFKITEIGNTSTSTLAGNYFEIDVGYPGDNFVTNFVLENGVYFPLVYKYNEGFARWNYDIDNYGNVIKSKNNPLITSNDLQRPNVVQSQWWKRVTEYPISATLTIKGLTRAVILTSYIKVNVLFYGQTDLASGVYAVVGQSDSVSGAGCTTTLSLLRVGSD